MLNKLKFRRRGTLLILVLLTVTSTNIAFAQQGKQPEDNAEIPSAGNPEYKIKPLPNDTFKPSEKISEDFPVPFPVDI